MSYDEQIKSLIENAKRELDEIAGETKQRQRRMEVEQEVHFHQLKKDWEAEAKESLEATKRTLLLAATGILALLLLGFLMFIYYEAKDINRSILSLHSQIQDSKNILDEEVSNFRAKSEELGESLQAAMEENRAALSDLNSTSSLYESRLMEIQDATQAVNEKLWDIRVMEDELDQGVMEQQEEDG